MEDIVIIGAGPYGLSTAAHVAAKGKRLRVFGSPMHTWRTQMPEGMHLKSEGFASRLYDPKNEYPLKQFCQERGLPYKDIGLPVERRVFAAYGEEFARRFVPMLEDQTVTALRATKSGFEVETSDGQAMSAKQVVCAVGITHYAYTPPALEALPPSLLSHSSLHHDLSKFKGQRVAVVGGGASAADCAGLLAEAGAAVHMLTRRPALAFHAPPKTRSLKDRLRAPFTTIGPGWKSVLCTEAPLVFHAMPEPFRIKVTQRYLGPAPCWFIRDKIEGGAVQVHTGVRVTSTAERGGCAVLHYEGMDGSTGEVEVDHVLSATGYRVNLNRLAFLDEGLRSSIRVAAGAPTLTTRFESTVRGLYFVGPAAANAFGPLLRFACGAEFTARRLSRTLH